MTDAPQDSSPCPKCGGGMQIGFVLDESYGTHHVSQWVAGEPVKSFWVGTKKTKAGLIPIGTFRCTSCGFLESYARPEFAAK